MAEVVLPELLEFYAETRLAVEHAQQNALKLHHDKPVDNGKVDLQAIFRHDPVMLFLRTAGAPWTGSWTAPPPPRCAQRASVSPRGTRSSRAWGAASSAP